MAGKVVEPPGLATRSKGIVDAVAELRLKTTTSIANADMVCAADFQHFNSLTKWYIYLNGGALVQAECIDSRGKPGACIALAPAVNTRAREVWVSASFAVNNPEVVRILEDAMGTDQSKWKWFRGSNHEFLARAMHAKHLVGIVTDAEFEAFPRGFVNVKTVRAFLIHICEVVEKDTHMFRM